MKKFILLIMVLIITGCGNAKLKNPEEVVFELDGKTFRADEFYNNLKNRYGIELLMEEIDGLILNELYETTTEMENEVKTQILTYKEQLGDQFEVLLKQQLGINSEEEFEETLILDIKKNKAIEDYAKSLITEEDIEKYYNEKAIGDIKASHILIKPVVTEEMTTEQIEAAEEVALEKAKDIIKKLDNNEKFEDLAKEYSEDTGNKDKGGDLGYFNRNDMVEEFENAAIALKINEYSKEPVKTQFGYHIILKTGEKEKAKLEDEKENILKILTDEKISTTTNLLPYAMEILRNELGLKIHDSQMNTHYDIYLKNQKNQ